MTESEYTNEQLIDFMYDVMDWRDVVDHPMIYAVIEALKERHAYREIGTVEECRIAVEKHNKKIKPLKVHNRFVCPCCTNSRQEVIVSEDTRYCYICGRGFDWSEGE